MLLKDLMDIRALKIPNLNEGQKMFFDGEELNR